MGSSSSSPAPAPAQQPAAPQPANGSSHGSKLHSKLSSSFGAANPFRKFEEKLRDWADEEKIPAFRKQLKYQVYEWRKGVLGHHSVVIGCESRANAGYVTMELRVDDREKKEKVYPSTQYFCRSCGEELIESKKWVLAKIRPLFDLQLPNVLRIHPRRPRPDREDLSWDGEVETTMEYLMELSIELIRKHGKYSAIANSCQHFVRRFVTRCAQKEKPLARPFQLQGTGAEEACIVGGGGGGGALSGAVIGGLTLGPPGAVGGAFLGLAVGPIASVGAVAVARDANTDSAVHEVRLAKD